MHCSTKKRKPIKKVILIVCIVFVLFLSGILIVKCANHPQNTVDSIYITDYTYNALNNLQISKDSCVLMTSLDNKLYLYVKHGYGNNKQFQNKLSVFENGGLVEVSQTDMEILAFVGEYMYGYRCDDQEYCTIYAYNIKTGQETELVTLDNTVCWNSYISNSFFTTDGVYGLPNRSTKDENGHIADYFAIEKDCVTPLHNHRNEYRLGNRVYYEDVNYYSSTIYCQEDGKDAVALDISEGYPFIIPVDQGLLIYVTEYFSTEAECLYFITEESAEPICLFAEGNHSYSTAINMHNEDVYISIGRVSEGGFVAISWDSLNGTYRINLKDKSVKKLSDKVYSGLFIFDNSGIFACDMGSNVYKLDFDGNIEALLLKE